MDRLSKVMGHLTMGNSDHDIVIVSAVRTAIGRAKKGVFGTTHPGDLLAAVLKASVERVGVKPSMVDDIVVGNVLAPGGFSSQARMAMFLAGFSETTAISTCNRQCSSGLQALAHVAGNIRSGFYDIGIAAGVESMSTSDMMGALGDINPKVFENKLAADCLNTMGQTSENVAAKFGIDRMRQDQMAVESHKRALNAQKHGYFKNEIVPVSITVVDKEGKEKTVVVTQDDGPREGTTLEGLQKLKPAFKKGGTTTAGNASQVSDGAAAILVMTRKKAKELGLTPLATFRAFAAKGVPPDIMGIGPAVAIPAVLAQAGLKVEDIDVYEINEAFASQAVYCVEKLGIPMSKVNPNGGAIALGHPLGCTGARQVATIINELKRIGGKRGVVSMCIGTGMGAAAVIELD
eukprot:gb/GEZN01006905.1/.p1 GENE.gb/GEZN01006905.1/~~gb/GEZN01006905.1/.p1  ORF type:complete len:405 (-),score=52.18 gb/GEZN01006905.1/:353-1567(-)